MPRVLMRMYVVLFFLFLLAPIMIVVIVSFTAQSYITFPIEGFSIRWFVAAYSYPAFINAFVVSLEIAFLSAITALVLGVPAALALARGRSAMSQLLMTALLSPLAMPLVVLGFALLFYLSALGIGVSFLALLIAHTVVSLPYVVRTVAAQYRSLSLNQEEAALVLGASRLQVFWEVTFPRILPGMFAGALLAILISIDNLPVSYFFGSPRTNTLPVVVLSYLQNQFDPSVAAVSTIQLGFAIVALGAVQLLTGRAALTRTIVT
jgi:putative spermidine/putrescine transport system permease protein